MQVAETAAPHKAVSKDQSRPILTRVNIIIPPKPKGGKKAPPWTGTIMATDSYQGVVHVVTFDEDDRPREGTFSAPAEAFRNAKVSLTIDASRERKTNGPALFADGVEYPLEEAKNLPDLVKIKPEAESKWEIGVNIDVLKKAIDALGCKEVVVRFAMVPGGKHPSPLRPIVVRPLHNDDGSYALVMPMRFTSPD